MAAADRTLQSKLRFFNVRMFLQSLWPGLHAPARQHAHTHSINQNFKQSQNPGSLTSQISHHIETVARVLKSSRPIKAFPKKVLNSFVFLTVL